jgi:hypothetical protein
MNTRLIMTGWFVFAVFVLAQDMRTSSSADPAARDPGIRYIPSDTGAPVAGLSKTEEAFFLAGKDEFSAPEDVAEGLGPTMNLDSCAGCHSQPAVGGSSPPVNPQVAFANQLGARNRIPAFVRADGPVREVRFVRNPDGSADGGVLRCSRWSGAATRPGAVSGSRISTACTLRAMRFSAFRRRCSARA